MLFSLPRCGLPRVWEDSPRSLSWACEVLVLVDVVSWRLSVSDSRKLSPSVSDSWKLSSINVVSSRWIFGSAFRAIWLHDLHILDRGQDLHITRERRLGFFGSFRS